MVVGGVVIVGGTLGRCGVGEFEALGARLLGHGTTVEQRYRPARGRRPTGPGAPGWVILMDSVQAEMTPTRRRPPSDAITRHQVPGS